MHSRSLTLVAVAISGVAACGSTNSNGSATATVTLAPIDDRTIIASGSTITDNGDGTLTFRTNEAEFTAAEATTPSAGQIYGYANAFGSLPGMRALHVETAGVRAGLVVNESGRADPAAGGFLERTVATTMPTSGSARYTGAYIGFLGEGASVPVSFYNGSVYGDATLNVEFGDSQVTGAITNRAIPGINHAFEDITFDTGTIASDGTFSGTLSGGEYTEGARTIVTPGTGSYAGLIAGANADEIVGGLSMTHRIKNAAGADQDYSEVGLIHAER